MADAILSTVAERFGSIIQDKIWEEVDLVRGFDDKIEYLSIELKKIRQLLDGAQKKGLTGTTKSMSEWKSAGGWLTELEDASYELDDVLDEWYTALREFEIQQIDSTNLLSKVCNYTSFLSCSCFSKLAVRRDTSKNLDEVKQKIDSILAEKDRYGLGTTVAPHSSTNGWRGQTTSFVEMEKIYGRDIERDDLVRRVISVMPQAGDQTNHLQILSIVGVGGLGKTTLAQLVYNDTRVTQCFELRIWICVSDPFDEVRVAKAIIQSVTKESPNSNELEFLLQILKDCISRKKFLLVMDDVWTEDSSKWEPLISSLKNGRIGSKVLVTTRNERVVKMMGSREDEIHRLGLLSDKNCWLLLQRIALFGRDGGEWKRFKSVGMNIANKCKGLPLAAKVLGSFLRFKTRLEEWDNVLYSEIWELEEAQVELFPHLLLSYNEMSPSLKRCFSYCAVFPKDTRINVEELIGHWMAVGYLGSDGSGTGDMELKGREYYDNLAMRSLLQDFKKNDLDGEIEHYKMHKNDLDGQIEHCKMHDIVHDFAQLVRKKEDREVGIKNTSTCKDCSPLLVSQAKHYRSMYFGNEEPNWPLCSCLANLRVLSLFREFQKQSKRFIIPRFIHLRWLDLSHNDLAATKDLETICRLYNLQTLLLWNCNLEEIPSEIGNLIHLRHLNLSENEYLKELPESICDLQELQRLNIDFCEGIHRLPQGFHSLVNLKHLHNSSCGILDLEGVAQLTSLRTLTEFNAGGDRNKLRWLKNLNRLSGSLELNVYLSGPENIVNDVREGELGKKERIQALTITFHLRSVEVEDCEYWENVVNALEPHPQLPDEVEECDEYWESVVNALEPHPQLPDEVEECDEYWESVLNALEPHPQLSKLQILSYGGSKLPSWMALPVLNQLMFICLKYFSELSSLPPLGRLPCLEEIQISGFEKLEVVGPEFLGTTTQGSNGRCIAFPKLKRLSFNGCVNWREWEDITTTEEEAADPCVAISVMPCLTELNIISCENLTELPHRLLGSSLEKLNIFLSTQLKKCYDDRKGSAWKSISDVCPRLQLI